MNHSAEVVPEFSSKTLKRYSWIYYKEKSKCKYEMENDMLKRNRRKSKKKSKKDLILAYSSNKAKKLNFMLIF
jgi:hypothetical protein